MRAIYASTVDPHRALSDDALDASLEATIKKKPPRAGWWVFAYGSLLWNPLFPFADARPAMVCGLHRRFCLWSLGSRGTVAAPGLVLGLDRGGSCRGVAYRLPANCARAELALLWRREMVVGSYRPRWLHVRPLQSAGQPLVALAFVVDRTHPQYAGRLPAATAGKGARDRGRRIRVIGGLSRARAGRAGHARRGRSLSRTSCRGGRASARNAAVEGPRRVGRGGSRRLSPGGGCAPAATILRLRATARRGVRHPR